MQRFAKSETLVPVTPMNSTPRSAAFFSAVCTSTQSVTAMMAFVSNGNIE